jgi:hypothetical protein
MRILPAHQARPRFPFLFPLLCALAAVPVLLHPGPADLTAAPAEDGEKPNPNDDWRAVPAYGTILIRRSVNWLASDPKNRAEMSENTNILALIRLTGAKEAREDGETVYRSSGSFQIQGRGESMTLSRIEDGEPAIIRQHHTASGGGATEFEGQILEVNPALGKFRLRIPTVEVPGKLVSELIAKGVLESKGTREGPVRMGVADFPKDALRKATRNAPYNPKGGRIRGECPIAACTVHVASAPLGRVATFDPRDPLLAAAAAAAEDGAWIKPVHLHHQWSLSLKPETAKLEIEPDKAAFASWLPDPDSGAPLKITVRVTEPRGAKGVIRLRLVDVTAEPGECMNTPAKPDDTDKPDLVLEADPAGQAPVKVQDGGQAAETKEPVESVTILVKARDFGAWGRLEAEADVVTASGPETAQGRYTGKGGDLPYLTMPLDENDNRIADRWEQEKESGTDPSADLDVEPSRIFRGDGLTVYEEYRGFRVGGRHVRTDPRKQNLFLFDPDGLAAKSPVARGALGSLVVHFVTDAEMETRKGAPRYRVINRNTSGQDHRVDQHGLVVRKGTVDGAPAYNHPSADARPGAPVGPPVTSEEITVGADKTAADVRAYIESHRAEVEAAHPPGTVTDAWIRGMEEAVVGYFTAHEIGHGVGIGHHRPDTGPPYTCPIAYPSAGETPLTLKQIVEGKTPVPSRFCNRCLGDLKVNDRYR